MSSVKPHLHAQKPNLPVARHRSNTAGSSSSSTASTTSVDLDPAVVSDSPSKISFKEADSNSQDPPVDTGTIRCICRISDDDGFTIQCDKCLVWQHAFCVDIDKHNIPDQYLCDMCDPRPRYFNVKKAIEHQVRRSQAERKAEQEERRGGKRNVSPSGSNHRKKHSASADDIGVKRRKRSDGGDKTHPKRSASFGLKRKASDDTTEMWESALKQALSSALNKSDNDSLISGPDKKQKTGYVTITKYENSRESSPLTPRTVEHASRFDSDELTIKPAGKQSPTFKAEMKQEEPKSDQEKASTISISTRKLSADSTESINVTSPSPTRATPPPHIAFSSAGQENSANDSGDENVDIDGDVQMDPVSTHSPTSARSKVNHRKERPLSGKLSGDDDTGFASSLSSADEASDTDSASFSRTNGQVALSKVTLAKYRIRSITTDEDGSHKLFKRKPKSLPLNLPCKKLWMRNYLKESENAMVATKKAEEEAAAQVKKEPTPEVTPTDIMQEDEPMVDIVVDDKKESPEPALPSPPHQETEEPDPLDEHDIFSDNESTASTVPADDLDQSFLSTDPISDPTTEIHVEEVKEVTEEDDHPPAVLSPPALESIDNVESTKEDMTVVVNEPLDDTNASTEEITTTHGEEIEQASHLQNAAIASESDQESHPQDIETNETDPISLAPVDADQESQPQSQGGPKVVRLSVKEYLSKRAAAAQRGEEPTSDEKASSGDESSAVPDAS
ncbi:hypothetical protein BC943DRAFT_364163 [Umbelopsis sp. AD052]|nr:hypothetical protein BC943DRAFT_364163 [Umbelopsis sp. AD052]